MDVDILYDKRILNFLLNCPHENVALVDPRFKFTGEEVNVFAHKGKIAGLGKKMGDSKSCVGEAIGMYRFSRSTGEKLAWGLKMMLKKRGGRMEYEDVFDSIAKDLSMFPRRIPHLPWIEIDTKEDLAKAKKVIFPKVGE